MYYYNILPETIYSAVLNSNFYIVILIVLLLLHSFVNVIPSKGSNLPQVSFFDVKSISPVTLIGVVGELRPNETSKKQPVMHYTMVWRSEESGNVFVCKAYPYGHYLYASLLAKKRKLSFKDNELKFLDKPGSGILIKHKNTMEIVHPAFTSKVASKVFNDRLLIKLVHQNS